MGEVMQEVSHHLMSKSGKIGDVKKVYSHPQALAQCRAWLEDHLPGVRLLEVSSTARAAEKCGKDKNAAAISSELAARLYGLRVIKKRIEDNIHNFTRFLIISPKGLRRSGRDKTSILFSVRDRVGALHNMLKPFSEYGLNLTKIESRPSKKKAWEYIFFVDLEGHQEEARVKGALERLQEQCLFLKVLGSYPVMGTQARR
ncbi:MAG TPA: prephenate dehydratase domain-containing protein [Nitrospiria bacterium]|nr:prephenate dehydratase domain-containing protein [Nitrospiria bacterium]